MYDKNAQKMGNRSWKCNIMYDSYLWSGMILFDGRLLIKYKGYQ